MASGWFSGHRGKDADDPIESFGKLATKHTPVQIEVEKSLLRFNAVLTLRERAVVISKPPAVQANLEKGDFVRLSWRDAGQKHGFRLEVNVPHFNLPNGSTAFICKLPEAAATFRRNHERHDLTRFKNVTLGIDGVRYRLIDLSATGCRVLATELAREHPVGKTTHTAILTVGDHEPIHFAELVVRTKQHEYLGCEFKVEQDGKSPKRLLEVLKSVEGREASQLRGE